MDSFYRNTDTEDSGSKKNASAFTKGVSKLSSQLLITKLDIEKRTVNYRDTYHSISIRLHSLFILEPSFKELLIDSYIGEDSLYSIILFACLSPYTQYHDKKMLDTVLSEFIDKIYPAILEKVEYWNTI
jgi:hypothetical protein